MRIHHYDTTGAYLGASDADRDPLGGGWLLPAWATIDPPPAAEPGCEVAMIAGAWQQREIEPPPAPQAPTLEEARAQARERLAERRWAAQTAGIEHAGHRWHTDTVSGAQMSIAIAAGYSGPWKTLDGWAQVTPADLQAVLSAGTAWVASCYAAESAGSQRIGEAVTAAEALEIGEAHAIP